MRYLKQAVLLLFAAALLSCSSTGSLITAPQTPEEQIAAGYITLDELTKAATQAVRAKKMSSADGQHVLNTVQTARQGLDVARPLIKLDPNAANAKIAAQMAIIKALQDYLATKGG